MENGGVIACVVVFFFLILFLCAGTGWSNYRTYNQCKRSFMQSSNVNSSSTSTKLTSGQKCAITIHIGSWQHKYGCTLTGNDITMNPENFRVPEAFINKINKIDIKSCKDLEKKLEDLAHRAQNRSSTDPIEGNITYTVTEVNEFPKDQNCGKPGDRCDQTCLNWLVPLYTKAYGHKHDTKNYVKTVTIPNLKRGDVIPPVCENKTDRLINGGCVSLYNLGNPGSNKFWSYGCNNYSEDNYCNNQKMTVYEEPQQACIWKDSKCVPVSWNEPVKSWEKACSGKTTYPFKDIYEPSVIHHSNTTLKDLQCSECQTCLEKWKDKNKSELYQVAECYGGVNNSCALCAKCESLDGGKTTHAQKLISTIFSTGNTEPTTGNTEPTTGNTEPGTSRH